MGFPPAAPPQTAVPDNQWLLRMTREARSACCCCTRPQAHVFAFSHPTPLGTFTDPCSCTQLVFDVKIGQRSPFQEYTLDGGCCCCQPGWCCPLPCGPCSRVTFELKSKHNPDHNWVAKITRKIP